MGVRGQLLRLLTALDRSQGHYARGPSVCSRKRYLRPLPLADGLPETHKKSRSDLARDCL